MNSGQSETIPQTANETIKTNGDETPNSSFVNAYDPPDYAPAGPRIVLSGDLKQTGETGTSTEENHVLKDKIGDDANVDWKKKGNEAFSSGDYHKAIEFYTNGIEFDPSNAALFSNRSAAYLKAEDFERAQADADMCIAINSKWPKGYWRKGQAYIELEQYEDAVKTYDEGLKNCDNDENLIVGRRKAQRYLDIWRAHQRGLPVEDDTIADSSRGGATAFMAAIDSQNKFGPEADVSPGKRSRRQSATAAANGNDPRRKNSDPNMSHKFPGTQEEEILRISTAPNYYAVLHVSSDATTAQMKKNYHTLARMLHPDKCQIDGADNAMKEVVQAYTTLTNSIKKTLYDQYMKDRRDSQAGGEQTYAEWEARQQPVNMPKWLRMLLGIKGCGWFITIILMILTIPLILLGIAVVALVWLICLPYRTVLKCCFPEKYERMLAEHEREREKLEEEAQDRMHAHL